MQLKIVLDKRSLTEIKREWVYEEEIILERLFIILDELGEKNEEE